MPAALRWIGLWLLLPLFAVLFVCLLVVITGFAIAAAASYTVAWLCRRAVEALQEPCA